MVCQKEVRLSSQYMLTSYLYTHMAIHTTTPVEERHVVHHDDDSSAGMIAVLLVAAVLIIGFLLFAMQAFPFNAAGTGGANLNIDVPDVNMPAVGTPDVNVNQENNTTPTE